MEQESRSDKYKNMYGNALNMSDEEKTISFLNRYFIFKKIRNIDSESIKTQYREELTEEEKIMAEKILEDMEKTTTDYKDNITKNKEMPLDIKVKSKTSKLSKSKK